MEATLVVVAAPKKAHDVGALSVGDVDLVRAIREVVIELGEAEHRALGGRAEKGLHARKHSGLGLMDRDALVYKGKEFLCVTFCMVVVVAVKRF